MPAHHADYLDIIRQRFNRAEFRELHWEGSFRDYLKLIQENPLTIRNAYQRMYDMILSFGVEPRPEVGESVVHYKFFDDPFDGGKDAIFGLDAALGALVGNIKSAAFGYGVERRVLVGDVGQLLTGGQPDEPGADRKPLPELHLAEDDLGGADQIAYSNRRGAREREHHGQLQPVEDGDPIVAVEDADAAGGEAVGNQDRRRLAEPSGRTDAAGRLRVRLGGKWHHQHPGARDLLRRRQCGNDQRGQGEQHTSREPHKRHPRRHHAGAFTSPVRARRSPSSIAITQIAPSTARQRSGLPVAGTPNARSASAVVAA